MIPLKVKGNTMNFSTHATFPKPLVYSRGFLFEPIYRMLKAKLKNVAYYILIFNLKFNETFFITIFGDQGFR